MTTATMDEPSIPANKRKIIHGGMMRCCIATLQESEELTDVGTVLSCKYEGGENRNMIVNARGNWEWNHA